MIAFLDAKAVIYLLEGSTEFSAQVRDTLKQWAAANSKLRLAVSELTRLECRVQPLRMADTQLLATYDTFFSLADLIQIPLSAQVIDLATVIRARHNLKTPDALQAACCLQ
ncbi:MAG: PIN domain-containing protein, partial [Sinobacteraceae bacterium]|nr:PIN domain-containing protein [Nevskiaceae bacterium]